MNRRAEGGFVDENTRQRRINNDQRQTFACIFYAADKAGAGAKVLALGERRRIEKRCLRWE